MATSWYLFTNFRPPVIYDGIRPVATYRTQPDFHLVNLEFAKSALFHSEYYFQFIIYPTCRAQMIWDFDLGAVSQCEFQYTTSQKL